MNKLKRITQHGYYCMLPLLCFSNYVHAQQGGQKFIGFFKEQFGQVAQITATLVSVAAFMWVAWIALSKFNECRQGRADWGEMITISIIGAAILVVVGMLLTGAIDATKL